MSKNSQQVVLSAKIEADSIRVSGTDLITLAISNREDELENELKSLKEESSKLSESIDEIQVNIDKEIQKSALSSIETKAKKAIDALSAISDVDFVLSNNVFPLGGNDFSNLSKTIQSVAKINGYKKGEARKGSCCFTNFELPISFDTPKAAIKLSLELNEAMKRYNKISQRMADISTQLRNVDRMTRKAHASMIKKAISNSPEMQKMIPVLTDKM